MIMCIEKWYLDKSLCAKAPDTFYFSVEQPIMLSIFWGTRSCWFFLVMILLSQRLLLGQVDQYYEVSKEAFRDMVRCKCQKHVTYSDGVMECSQFCSLPNGRRCSAFALGHSSCWVCSEDIIGNKAVNRINAATEFWVHSGEYKDHWLNVTTGCVQLLPAIIMQDNHYGNATKVTH